MPRCSTFRIVGWRGRDRAADLPRGVRAGPSGGRPDDVLVREPAGRRCGRDCPPTCSSTATRRPSWPPGSRRRSRTGAPARAGDRATAQLVADTFAARGFAGGGGARPVVQRFTSDGKRLVNVVGRRAGSSRRQIVIVAARDAASVPDAPGSAADTAALHAGRARVPGPAVQEDARARVDRRLARWARRARAGSSRCCPSRTWWTRWSSSRTSAHGAAGRPCRRGRTTPPARASPSSEPWPSRSGWSSAARPEAAARSGSSRGSRSRSGSAPRACCSTPGYDAVRISGSGELPPGGSGPPEAIDPDRLGGLGRAALRTLTAAGRRGRARSTGRRATCRR